MYKGKFIPITAEFNKMLIGLLISDFKWWIENQEEIIKWSNSTMGSTWEKQGMIVYFDNEEDRLQFLLRWGHD
jgi:hypothetical protein